MCTLCTDGLTWNMKFDDREQKIEQNVENLSNANKNPNQGKLFYEFMAKKHSQRFKKANNKQFYLL